MDRQRHAGRMPASAGLLALLLLFLCSCAQSPGQVRLASPEEIQRWCGEECGPCTIGSIREEDSSVTLTLQDEEGFSYQAGSRAEPMAVDGTVFWYSEGRWTDFDEVYADRFLEQHADQLDRICLDRGVTLEFGRYLRQVSGEDAMSVQAAGEAVMELVCGYDTRGYWDDMSIFLQVQGREAGDIRRGSGYRSQNDLACGQLLEAAASEMRRPVSDLVYVSSETKPVDEIPGSAGCTRASILGTDNSTRETALVVTFEVDGKEYFVADLVVYSSPDSGQLRHLGNYEVQLSGSGGRAASPALP